MALMSKPYKIAFQAIGSYLGQLYLNPLRTKSITSCIVALLANYTAQRMNSSRINHDSLIAFGLYGLLFGGPVPHFFYEIVGRIISQDSPRAPLQLLCIERLLFMPLYQLFSLYMLSRLEGKNHELSLSHVSKVYLPVVQANWKYLTLFQYLNIYFVPPMLRVLVANMIGFLWAVFIAKRRASRKQDKSE